MTSFPIVLRCSLAVPSPGTRSLGLSTYGTMYVRRRRVHAGIRRGFVIYVSSPSLAGPVFPCLTRPSRNQTGYCFTPLFRYCWFQSSSFGTPVGLEAEASTPQSKCYSSGKKPCCESKKGKLELPGSGSQAWSLGNSIKFCYTGSLSLPAPTFHGLIGFRVGQ